MLFKIQGQKNFFLGTLFLLIALFFITAGRNLAFGTAEEMGPGYFPLVVCLMLAAVGITHMVRGLTMVDEGIGVWRLRPPLFVLGSILVFAFALQPLGLILTTFLTVGVASFATGKIRPLELFLIAAAMAAGCSIIFVVGLKLLIPLWPNL